MNWGYIVLYKLQGLDCRTPRYPASCRCPPGPHLALTDEGLTEIPRQKLDLELTAHSSEETNVLQLGYGDGASMLKTVERAEPAVLKIDLGVPLEAR